MLRKTAKAMLVTMFSLSLCACGASGGNQVAPDAQTKEEATERSAEETDQDASALLESLESNTEEDASVIEFDDVTVLDDDRVTVKLLQFYEKEVNWVGSSAPVMEKYFTIKVNNKTDGDILFNVNDGYINDESVTVGMVDGNSGPAAGKWKSYSYNVRLDTSPEAKPLESLDDLYGFEATIQTYCYDSNGYLVDERKDQFSMADVLGNKEAGIDTSAESVSADDVVSALQGSWLMGDSVTVTFDGENISFNDKAVALSGAYEVDMNESAIIGHLEATDGIVNISLPFEYDGETLKVFKNKDMNDELVKQ